MFVDNDKNTLLHSEWPKLYRVLATMSAEGMNYKIYGNLKNHLDDVTVNHGLNTLAGTPRGTINRSCTQSDQIYGRLQNLW